ncbi:MAG: ABC transporter ATP-binding protein [Firmicutes bacterium]|nr:ABC transporter ATP-binding protein [Bacillota bacterium]
MSKKQQYVRPLEELSKKYQSIGKAPGGRGGGPGGGPRGAMMTGKPQNRKGTMIRMFSYIGKYKPQLALALLCVLVSTGANLLGSYMLRPIINGLIANTDLNTLALSLAKMAAVYLIGVVANYTQQRTMIGISQGIMKTLRDELFAKVQKLPVRYYDNTSKGELMSRFMNDVDSMSEMLNNAVISLISGTVTLIGTLVLMLSMSVILTVVTIVFVPLVAWAGMAIANRSRKYYRQQQAALGAINGYIEESVTGSKVVKVFNHEEVCEAEFDLLNKDLRKKQIFAQFFGGIMGPVMGNLGQISYAVTACVGGILCVTRGFDVGGFSVFVNYSRQFSRPINELSQQMNTLFSAMAGAERVFAVMDQEPEPEDPAEAKSADDMKGYVEMKHVYFGYNPDVQVLKDISLYAKPGQKIAFVGSTGAGKTTVTNLLSRFYDIQEGEITIDGVSIYDYKRSELRRNIAMVLQDTHLFTGTVMENIRYGRPDATDEEVIATAKSVSADHFIRRLADGYQTVIDGDGTSLSQGQRQLLNIARAAISKAPILVLDEATSSVDTRTEKQIEQGMDALMATRTTFVIAHRLSTVRDANAIMVLEHGVIIERGTHEDLLAQKGRYYELYTGKAELD